MTKEKTIREWLEELPDGYRELALKNHDGLIVSNLSTAIMEAFHWRRTPEGEGHKFWEAVHVWSQGAGELPPLPQETGWIWCIQHSHTGWSTPNYRRRKRNE